MELNSNDADGYHGRGRAYLGLRDFQKAEADFSKALELYEEDQVDSIADVHAARSFAYGMQERFDDASQAIEKAIKLKPNKADYHNYLGWARGFASDIPGAIESFERSIELAPNGFHSADFAAFRIFCAGPEYGRSPQTLELAQKAVESLHKSSAAWVILGLAQCQSEDNVAALSCASKSLELAVEDPLDDSDFVAAQLVLAQSFHRLGDKEKAMHHYDQAQSRILAKDLASSFVARRTFLLFREKVADELGIQLEDKAPLEAAEK